MKFYTTLFSLLFLFPAWTINGQKIPDYTLEQKLDILCERQYEDGNFPGLSVMVAYQNELIFSKGLGYANIEKGNPVIPDKTLFRIGSISKSLTAAGLAKLVESNTIDLDDPIQKYVPYFPDKKFEITIRDLACHLAGIRHYRGLEYLSNIEHADVRSGIHIFQNDELIVEPKSQFKYSSYGWNLISAAIEGASNESFLPYMQKEVFIPLEMKHTFAEKRDLSNENIVGFYKHNEQNRIMTEIQVNNSYKWAGGGFLSTAEDLIKFAKGIMRNRLYNPGTRDLFWTSCELADGSLTNYGLGWFDNVDDDGRKMVGHSGGSVGGTSMLLIYPDEELIVVTLVNLSSAKMDNLARQLASTVLKNDAE